MRREQQPSDGCRYPARIHQVLHPRLGLLRLPRLRLRRDAPFREGRWDQQEAWDEFQEHGNQLALYWLLQSSRWNPPWAAVRASVGGDFAKGSWKQDLWQTLVWCQGLEGMEMIRPFLEGDLAILYSGYA